MSPPAELTAATTSAFHPFTALGRPTDFAGRRVRRKWGELMRALTIAAMLVSTVTGTADAQAKLNTETGYGLLDICSATDASGRDWMCYGYVLGIGAMLRDMGTVCFPPAATHAQMRNVVVQGLQAHPEEQHEAPEILVTKYLSTAFPCPRSK